MFFAVSGISSAYMYACEEACCQTGLKNWHPWARKCH